MDAQEVLKRLEQWEEAEVINRAVYRHRRGELGMEDLLARWSEDNYYLQIALDPEKYPDRVTAEYLLKGDRNVAINKHPRYSPMPLHTHEYFEMNYVVSGACTQRFEDGEAALTAGDLCMLSPDARHAIDAFSDDTIVLNIGIRQSTFLRHFADLPRRASAISSFFMDNLYSKKKLRYLLVKSAGDQEVRDLILRMYGEELERDPYTDGILISAMSILFNLLLRRHGERMEAPPMRRGQSALTDAMLSYIHAHYSDVTLDRLADEFHFSRQYCSRLIMELTGCSFSSLVTGVRIGHGEALLRDTFLSVEEIGEHLGYANPETFIRAFRRVKGVTPGSYRQEATGNRQ